VLAGDLLAEVLGCRDCSKAAQPQDFGREFDTSAQRTPTRVRLSLPRHSTADCRPFHDQHRAHQHSSHITHRLINVILTPF
jgi:hypothetical protein